MQETYITDELYEQWKKEWYGSFFYVKGTSNSNGLITLINPNIKLEHEPKLVLSDQRILAIEVKISNDYYIFLNTYAPNKKKQKLIFF